MFDAEKYFALVEDRLRTCQSDAKITSSVIRVEPNDNWDKWQLITWSAKIEWEKHGAALEVLDCWSRKRRDLVVMHTFRYQFMNFHNECIFRFDTEGEEIPYGSACHIHIGPGKTRLNDGDAMLHDYSLLEMNFPRMFGLVYKHIKGKKMPWD